MLLSRRLTASLWLLALSTTALVMPIARNLEYEYSQILTVLLIVVLPYLSLWERTAIYPETHHGVKSRSMSILWTIFGAPLCCCAPMVLMYKTALCKCSAGESTFFFTILVVPAVYLALAMAYGVQIMRRCLALSRFKLATLLTSMHIALLLILSLTLWFNPQKRITSLVYGYFHGPIYDAWLPVDNAIIGMRLLTIPLALLIIALVRVPKTWLRAGIALLLCLGMLTFATVRNHQPSLANNIMALDAKMPQTIRGDGFIMHYPAAFDTNTPKLLQRLNAETMFHMHELTALFGPHFKTVHIYVYPDITSKKLWFGASETDVTDVVTPSIHITLEGSPHPTLRHELVHAVASSFGFHGLGFHPHMAITEGLAMALAPSEDPVSLDEGAASILRRGQVSNLDELFSPNFFAISSTRAYTLAGSLISFIIKKRGFTAIARIYSGESLDEVLGQSKQTIIDDWRQHLFAKFPGDGGLLTEALYRYPGVLYDTCLHSKATLEHDGKGNLLISWRQPRSWNYHRDYWPLLLQIDPLNPQNRYQNLKERAKSMIIGGGGDNGEILQLAGEVSRESHFPPKTLEDIEFAIFESDLLLVLQQTPSSIALLNKLATYSQTHAIGNGLTRQIYARLLIHESLNAELARSYHLLLAGFSTQRVRDLGGTGTFIVDYLHVRNESPAVDDVNTLISYLNNPTAAAVPGVFVTEWYKYLGHRLSESRQFAKASVAYELAAKYASSGMQPVLLQYSRSAIYYSHLDMFKEQSPR